MGDWISMCRLVMTGESHVIPHNVNEWQVPGISGPSCGGGWVPSQKRMSGTVIKIFRYFATSCNILILPDYSTVHHQLTFAISVLQSMYKTCDKIFILLNMRYNFKLTDKWQPEFTCKHLPWWVENMIIYVEQVEQLEWHYPHKLLHKVRQKTAQVSN